MTPISAADPLTKSADIVAANLEKLQVLFPEAFSEGKIDFEVLRQLLGGAVEDREEKYGLNWNGKRQARQLALTPSTGTLRPCPEESVDWETTQNLMIEGDNLEVLKLLQKSYARKVKLIYIDPPYNTGKDFVYPDDYSDTIANYLLVTGQSDKDGVRISSNTETSGRFHTEWLNMILPRLMVAKNLLRPDGCVFISVDDGEVARLRIICDEVFGEENFVACIVWQKTYSPANDKKGIDAMHDYVLVYQRSEESSINLLPRTAKQDDAYSNLDNDPRGPWKAVDSTRAEHRDYAYFPITTPSGDIVYPASGRSWVFNKDEVPALIADGRLWFGRNGSSKPSKKLFLSEVKQGVVPTTWWSHEDAGHNDEAKKELKALLHEETPFQTPKPTRLIARAALLATSANSGDIVLDFFAGSGTTGHAILELNLRAIGDRRYVLVQLPESTDSARFSTIAEITKERLRRAGKKIKEENPLFAGDLGFRVFKLDTSNIRTWDPDLQNLEQTLYDNIDHLKEGRTDADILYELLLKEGLDLCVPIEVREIAGKEVHSIGAGTLFACLAASIIGAEAEPLAQGIASWYKELAPAKESTVIFRDSAFPDDVVKTNVTAILQQFGLKEVKSL